MKKILLLTLFLLTLLPTMNIGNTSSLSAQNYTYENGSWWLPDIDVKSENVRCAVCGHLYDSNNSSDHECTTTCEYCSEVVLLEAYKDHLSKVHYITDDNDRYGNEDDFENTYCPYCNRPYGTCTCGEVVINGKDKPSGNTTITIRGWDVSESSTWNKPPEKPSDEESDKSKTSKDTTLRVGGYYKAQSDCETLFKDSVLIPPLQPDKETCVSTALAYSKIWQENQSVEQFISAKENIENLFEEKYKRKLSKDGVPDSILQEFIQYSGINVQPVSLSELKLKISQGYSGLGTLVIKKKDGTLVGHEITIVGYDKCKDLFICKDPQKMELKKYSDKELFEFNSLKNGQNSIYYIEREFYKNNSKE